MQQPMSATFYYRADMQACVKVRRILQKLATEYALQISEVPVEPGGAIKAPAIGVEGGRLHVLDSSRGTLDEQTMRAYLELARASGASGRGAAGDVDSVVRKGRSRPSDRSIGTVKFQIKSYMWQHRVAMIVGA